MHDIRRTSRGRDRVKFERPLDAAKYRDNPKMIAKYLNDALATDDAALITKAIGDMLRAQGMSKFSQKVGLRRGGLYRSFRGEMSPGFDTVVKVLVGLDLQISVKPSAGSSRRGNDRLASKNLDV